MLRKWAPLRLRGNRVTENKTGYELMESRPIQTTAPASGPIRVTWNRRHDRHSQVRRCGQAVRVGQTTTGLTLHRLVRGRGRYVRVI